MNEILPIVMNSQFERLAVIDDYNSLIWTTRFYNCGDFEICVDVNENNVKLFHKDYYIMREDDENVGIIEKIQIQKDDDNHEILIITGRFLPSILARRIISKQTVLSGTVISCINKLITDEAIKPTIAARAIPSLTIASQTDTTPKIQAQFTGDNLLEAIYEFCQTYGIGFKTTLNQLNQFVCQVIYGIDHSYNQTVNPHVVFSDEFDNLLSSQYMEDYREIVTDVLVAGEGEGADRKTLWVNKVSNTGLNRYEIYKDRRDLQSNDGEITDEEYQAQMRESGLLSLNDLTTAFTGTVYFGNVRWKQDVNIGDICVIENTRWGIYINSRLIEVIESVSETGEYSIVPTFGI